MKKNLLLALLAAFAAATLCACSGSAAPATTQAPTAAVSSSASSEAESVVPSPEVVLPAAETGSLEEAANAIVGYEQDTAGGSLKTALAACGLLDWCAQNPDYDETDVAGRLADWYGTLDENGKTLFGVNIAAVIAQADNIVADPAGQAGLLESAGVETDYTDYDANFSGLRNALVAMIQSENVDVSAQSEVTDQLAESSSDAAPEETPMPGAVDAGAVLGTK